MPRRSTSQELVILELLESGVKVTPMMALNRCGCFRLAEVIHTLRKKGHPIKTNRIESHTGNRYAEYSLSKLI